MGLKELFKKQKQALSEKLKEAKKELFEPPPQVSVEPVEKDEVSEDEIQDAVEAIKKDHEIQHKKDGKASKEELQVRRYERSYSVQPIGKRKEKIADEEKMEEFSKPEDADVEESEEKPEEEKTHEEIIAEVVAEDLKLKEKAKEVLNAQHEAKRNEIMSMLDSAIDEWRKTGKAADDVEQRESIKEKLEKRFESLKAGAGSVIQKIKDVKKQYDLKVDKQDLAVIEHQLEPKKEIVKEEKEKKAKEKEEVCVESEIKKIYKDIEDV